LRHERRCRCGAPNDLVYASDGTLYFTDPPFGLADEAERELPFAGVFRLRDGELLLITDELAGPDGVALSPDERSLYVGNWDPEAKLVLRIDLVSGDRDILHDLTDAAGEDAIDGLEVDAAGNLFVCGPGGLWVISADGERLGRLELPDESGVRHRLSALQGDDVLVAHLSRGEHCPRERMFHRELLRFHEWCAVAFTQLVSILPNEAHDVYRMKIATVERVYVGYWFWGRPTIHQLWQDVGEVLQRTKADFDPTTSAARAAWEADAMVSAR
jgi:hypothetical protein